MEREVPAGPVPQVPGLATSAVESAPDAAQRFGGLEAYRGVAALVLIVFHAYQHTREGTATGAYLFQGTWLHALFGNLQASSWFFVLSGFLVFLPFARAAITQTEPRSARGFLVMRAIRILPPYYIAILLVWTLRFSGQVEEWVDLLQHLTFTHVFDRAHIFWTIGPAWTLAVEVQFYVLMVLVGALAYRASGKLATARQRAWLLALACLVLVVGSGAYKAWAAWHARIPTDDYPIYFGPAAKLDTLALGMLLAVIVAARASRPLLTGWAATLVRLAAIAGLAAVYATRSSQPGVSLYFHTLSGACFLLVLASTVLARPGSAWERALTSRPLGLLGAISYGLYLWHEPLLVELSRYHFLIDPAPSAFFRNATVLAGVSIAVAAASYWALERPLMELRHLFTGKGRLAPRYPSE